MKRYLSLLADRKIRAAALLLVAVFSVAVSGTLAYFIAATDSIQNDFIPAGLSIVIHEEFERNTENVYEKRNVTVENEVLPNAASSAFIRVKLIPSWRDASGAVVALPASLSQPGITLDIDVVDNFNLIDGCYYYKFVLAPGETTPPLINSLTVDYSAFTGTVYEGLVFELTVLAEGLRDAPGAAEAAWGMAYNKTAHTWSPVAP
ncbi:MAG: hypothetical protein IJK02_01990 [Clostridia bacterium]|nr:hypothetical protein [Clostridia bacterium]